MKNQRNNTCKCRHTHWALLGALTLAASNTYTIPDTRLEKAYCAIPVIHNTTELARFFPATSTALYNTMAATVKWVTTCIAEIVAIPPEKRTFRNTMVPLDRFRGVLNAARATFYICSIAHPNAVLRSIAHDLHVQMRKFWVDCSMDPKLYASIQAYLTGPLSQEKLTQEQQRFIKEMTQWFKDSGMRLPPEKQKELNEVRKQSIDRATAFTDTISLDGKQIWVAPEDLHGINPAILEKARRDDAGRYQLNTNRQVYREVITHGSEKVRKSLWQAYTQTAYPQNTKNLELFLELRQRQADLFGVPNYTYLELPEQMLPDATQVRQFLDGLTASIRPLITKLVAKLGESVELTTRTKKGKRLQLVQPWDWEYALQQFKETQTGEPDTEQVQEYFQLEPTVRRLFAYLGPLLGVTFKQESITLWHQSVICMGAYMPDGALLGYILLDLCARAGKTIQTSYVNIIPTIWCTDKIATPAVSAVFAHFQVAEACSKVLLSFRDLVTLCHEVGHALQGLFGRSTLITFSGTRVAWDFLESASQICELLVCQPDVLQKIGRHFKTDKPLPAPLAQKIYTELVCDYVKDLYFILVRAYFSLAAFDGSLGSSITRIKKTIHEQLLPPMVAYNPIDHFETAFTHILTYGSMYYGYLLSRLIALTVVKKMGPSPAPAMGKRFAQTFLGVGGTRDPWDIVADFVGKRVTLPDLYEALRENLAVLDPFLQYRAVI